MAVTTFPCDQAGSVNKPAPAGYTGPGDLATFNAWWGLRAYSTSQLGGITNAIRIVKASDGTAAQDIKILSTGALDTATIVALGYAVKIMTVYDQTGGGLDITNVTLSRMPDLTIGAAGLNAGLPAMTYTGAANQRLIKAGGFISDLPQPYNMSIAIIRRSTFTSTPHIIGAQGAFEILQLQASSVAVMYAGTQSANVSAPDGTWLAMNGLFSGASSELMVNGSNTTGLNCSTTKISTTEDLFLGGSDGDASLAGDVVEGGIGAATSSATFTAINNNQRAYWGF